MIGLNEQIKLLKEGLVAGKMLFLVSKRDPVKTDRKKFYVIRTYPNFVRCQCGHNVEDFIYYDIIKEGYHAERMVDTFGKDNKNA